MGLNTNSFAYTTYIQYEELGEAKLKDLVGSDDYFVHKNRICYRLVKLPTGDKRGKYKADQIITNMAIPEGQPKDIPVYFGRSVTVTKIKITLFLGHRDTVIQGIVHAWRPGYKKLIPHNPNQKLDWEVVDPSPSCPKDNSPSTNLTAKPALATKIGLWVDLTREEDKTPQKVKLTHIVNENTYEAKTKNGDRVLVQLLGTTKDENGIELTMYSEIDKNKAI